MKITIEATLEEIQACETLQDLLAMQVRPVVQVRPEPHDDFIDAIRRSIKDGNIDGAEVAFRRMVSDAKTRIQNENEYLNAEYCREVMRELVP